MAYDASRGNIVLFSGVRGDGSPPLADTWTFDGCRWTSLTPATSPPGRSFGAMTYDSQHGLIVLFGGGSANSDPGRNDTWTWDGRTWSQHRVTSPPVMAHASLEYDRASAVVVLIGQALAADATVVWTWDGDAWQQRHPANPPPGRSGAAVAYGARGGILFFGGQPGEAGALNDSWVWDGAGWTELHPASSPAGGYARMARDDARTDVVLVEADGTWTWNGSNWTATAGPGSPPFEYFRSIAYEAATHQVLLFGGKSSQTNLATDEIWTWDGTNWSSR